ncbi:response regulator transcription factor [Pseudoalteromonas sp. CNC9-20]|uniref:LuxR family transcriptional regulator n=1 Tax=Pseudoalteromonas sp. CNC9-20 TaxID=2917750 RepID=UPI001EF677C2|nr:response regulator transcription factor [Pseudoalteromonas sp. CNC9-20]MCG7570936.1 response regulator transcription factor [Pseudoalteromonas sp. CNC9-20]
MDLFITEQGLISSHWQRLGEPIEVLYTLPEQIPDARVAWVLTGMPDWQQIIGQLHARHIAIILMTRNPCVSELQHGFSLGARGYVELFATTAVLKQARDAIENNALWLPGCLLSNLIGALSIADKACSPTSADLSKLSERECEVAKLVAQGQTNKAIAARLYISERTVKQHLSSTFAKLQVKDRLQLALHVNGAGQGH